MGECDSWSAIEQRQSSVNASSGRVLMVVRRTDSRSSTQRAGDFTFARVKITRRTGYCLSRYAEEVSPSHVMARAPTIQAGHEDP